MLLLPPPPLIRKILPRFDATTTTASLDSEKSAMLSCNVTTTTSLDSENPATLSRDVTTADLTRTS